MKRFKLTIIYIIGLAVLNYFHYRVESFLVDATGKRFLVYVIYGLFAAFFLVLSIKALPSGKNLELAVVLLAMGMIFFFLVSRSPLIAKFHLVEFFLLGVLAALENKKTKSILPFLWLLVGACLVELAGNFSRGSTFYYLDVWLNMLTALAGYSAGYMIV